MISPHALLSGIAPADSRLYYSDQSAPDAANKPHDKISASTDSPPSRDLAAFGLILRENKLKPASFVNADRGLRVSKRTLKKLISFPNQCNVPNTSDR